MDIEDFGIHRIMAYEITQNIKNDLLCQNFFNKAITFLPKTDNLMKLRFW